jgi:hypothetical protein
VARLTGPILTAVRRVSRGCSLSACYALLAWACCGLACDGGSPRVIDGQTTQATIEERVAAASAALYASSGHDYGPITELLRDYYGDEETTAAICGAFADPPNCLRIAAVNVQGNSIDAQWQEHFCQLERQAWEAFPWSSGTPQQQIDETADEHFEECMMGMPFVAR